MPSSAVKKSKPPVSSPNSLPNPGWRRGSSTSAAPVAAAPNTMAAVVDEIGAIEADLAPFKARIARLDLLRKSLRFYYDSEPSGESFNIYGAKYFVLVGAKANETVIDVAGLFKAVGSALFLKICSVTKKRLEEAVPADVAVGVMSVAPTGARTLAVMPIPRGGE